MAHRFPIKEIAHQAGVSVATVDRVINDRPGVRLQTANRVRIAIDELEAQEAQLSMRGRKLMLDLLVEAPRVFLDALQSAVVRELPLVESAIFRVRSDMRPWFPADRIVAGLDRARKLGSDGVIIMAPDSAAVRAAIDRLVSDGIPVVTLATDMPGTMRSGYVGLDNARAGETAAWMVRQWAGETGPERVFMTMRNERFRGEGERERGFREAMARLCPGTHLEMLVQGQDGPEFADRVAQEALRAAPAALYSIGGGNRALIAAFDRAGVTVPLFIVHDLDHENSVLLADGRIEAVLYHDLDEDIRNAYRLILSARSNGAMAAPADGAALRVMLPPMFRP